MNLCIMQCIPLDTLWSILEQPMDTMVLGTMEWVWVTMGWVILEWDTMVWDIMQWVWDTMDLGSMMTQVTTA